MYETYTTNHVPLAAYLVSEGATIMGTEGRNNRNGERKSVILAGENLKELADGFMQGTRGRISNHLLNCHEMVLRAVGAK